MTTVESRRHGHDDRALATFLDRWAEAIVSNDVEQMACFTTQDWVLVDTPGTITRDAFHGAVASGQLRHHWMSHEVLDIRRCGDEIALVRTHGRNAGTFQGKRIAADEWTTNILVREAGQWRCVLTQLTPTGAAVQTSRVTPEEWRRFRAMRLAALAESPSMFGSTLAREQSFDEVEWRARAQRPVTFLASRAGRDVGLAGVHEFEGRWQVVSMWIMPEARGTGVVDALMEACEGVVREAGASSLILGVMEDNPAGLQAYRRLGFTFTGHRQHVRDDRDELWMSKTL